MKQPPFFDDFLVTFQLGGSKPYHTRNIDTTKTLNMEQILRLLEASKDTPIHMQVLFNVLMGLRRQEYILHAAFETGF